MTSVLLLLVVLSTITYTISERTRNMAHAQVQRQYDYALDQALLAGVARFQTALIEASRIEGSAAGDPTRLGGQWTNDGIEITADVTETALVEDRRRFVATIAARIRRGPGGRSIERRWIATFQATSTGPCLVALR